MTSTSPKATRRSSRSGKRTEKALSQTLQGPVNESEDEEAGNDRANNGDYNYEEDDLEIIQIRRTPSASSVNNSDIDDLIQSATLPTSSRKRQRSASSERQNEIERLARQAEELYGNVSDNEEELQTATLPRQQPKKAKRQRRNTARSPSLLETPKERLARLQEEEIRMRIAATQSATANALRESNARIAAMSNAPEREARANEGSSRGASFSIRSGKIPAEVLVVARMYIGIDKVEIGRIFDGSFDPCNLYKLRQNTMGTRTERKTRVTIGEEDGMVFEKAVGKVTDYGPNSSIWSETFLKYTSILIDFFGVSHPSLHHTLLAFHEKICFLAGIYEWTTAVLPLALDFHIEVVAGIVTDSASWSIPESVERQYCTANRTRGFKKDNSRPRGYTDSKEGSSRDGRRPAEVPQDWDKSLCWNFNNRTCNYKGCQRIHNCSECGSNHPVKEHNDKKGGKKV